MAFALPAQAQATRTWVSGVGDDANPCSRTAPCKTFAGAISKTAAGGEINIIDPGGFGAVTITKSISIVAEGATAGVLSSFTNGIIVNLPAATDRVVLQGLDIEGANTGLNGIRMIGLGRLLVKNCDIRNFRGGTGFGIDVQAPAGARVMIENTTFTNNNGAINVKAAAGSNIVLVENALIDSNKTFGIRIDGTSTLFLSSSFIGGQPSNLSTLNGGTITSY
ncbi:MAG TPA: right-handed parallel beta-helix repeat-containing protein, partial [Aestuariivirga sp.]|nr:right-handed parallel beta-helix repeat-containing protein [Aestuariivirga sp.]